MRGEGRTSRSVWGWFERVVVLTVCLVAGWLSGCSVKVASKGKMVLTKRASVGGGALACDWGDSRDNYTLTGEFCTRTLRGGNTQSI